MSLPVFPPELGPPLRDGYGQGMGDNRRMFGAEAGPIVPRARFSQVADPVSMALVTDRNGRAVFEDFYIRAVKRGSLPFLMPDPGTDGAKLLAADGQPILLPNGDPLLIAMTWVCLFGEAAPKLSPTGSYWQISFNISVMP